MTESLVVTNDGEIPFLRPQKGVDPVVSADLATKGYGDAHWGGGGGGGLTESEVNDLIDAAMTTHLAASDPHPGYTTAAELASAISAHEALSNPHPTYTTDAEATALAAAEVATHVGLSNPHTQYVRAAAGAFTTLAPTSAVAAANGTNELVRAVEVDSLAALTVSLLAGKQPLDATLTALAGLATGADKIPYSTGTDTFSQATLTSFARTILDDTSGPGVCTTIGASQNGHGHAGDAITLDDSGWSAALAGSGVRECQALADFIDTGMQPLSAALTAIAALTTSADKITYATGSNTFATVTLTSFIRTLLDDTDAATARTTLGAQSLDATLTALAGLATGADKLAYSTGTDTFSQADLTSFGRSLIDDADAAAARTTLGAQALDATLTALAGLATGADKLAYSTGTDAFAQTDLTSFARTVLDDTDAATARTTLDVRYPHVYTIWAGPTVNWAVPSSETLFNGSAPWSCRPYDGTRATQARITACHAGAASSGSVHLTAKYTTNGQAAGTYNTVGTWTQLGASAQVVLTLGTGAGANYLDSGWIDIASGAKIDGMIAVTGDGGNGSTSVTFYSVNVEFR